MENPKAYRYTKDHEWVCAEGPDKGKVGLTKYAGEQLGDIVYLELPGTGSKVKQSGKMGEVESVKSVSEIFSPVSGEVVAVNDAVKGAPEEVNEDPYGKGWLIKLKISNEGELGTLMDAASYDKYVSSLTEK